METVIGSMAVAAMVAGSEGLLEVGGLVVGTIALYLTYKATKKLIDAGY